MSILRRAIETAEEVVCVSALAAILGADAEEAEPEVGDVVDAVQKYRDQTGHIPANSWVARLMYSKRVLGWLSGRIITVAREQGAYDHIDTARQADEPGTE